MLTRLHVRGFKSLEDVEVELAPLVVLLGPNAAGKSNFLEALLLLSRLVMERTLGDAFTAQLRGYPVEAFRLPEEGLQELLTQERAELSMEADIRPSAPPGRRRVETLRYRVGVRIQPKTGALNVADEYLARLKKDGSPKHKPRIERSDGHLLVRRLGEAGQPRREPLGLNHPLASNLQFSGDKRYPDFDRLRRELSSWRTFYFDPRLAMRQPKPPMETEDIGPRGELIAPFLYRLKEDKKHRGAFDAIRRALHSAIPSIENLDVDLDPKRGTLDIVIQQDGTAYSSRVISEGTLRVLALCAMAANPWSGRLLAFEEPENGVQPRRVETVADLLISMAGRRQVIVTTHSPTLIAAFARRRREQKELGDRIRLLRCTQDGRMTHIEPFPDLGPLFNEPKIRDALTSPDDADVLAQALLRGWLDG